MTDFERDNFEREDQESEELRPEQIERNIAQTRERMGRDIDALSEKLRPGNLAHDAVDSVTERARQTGSRIADFVRDNPLPVVAAGLGVTWLMTQRSRSAVSGDRMAQYAYTGPERRTLRRDRRGLGTRIGEAADQAREAMSSAASTAAERASELGTGAKSQVQELGTKVRNRAIQNPLAVAAGAAIIGLAAGLLIPETRRERQMMGAARDRLAERAGDAAGEVKETLKAELAERGPQVKDMAQDVARRVVDQAKESAGRVTEQAKTGKNTV